MEKDPENEGQWARLIRNHGTPEEQLPRPGDNEIKILSDYMFSFIEDRTDYQIEEVSFSYFGQIEEDYFVSKDILEVFDKPQATLETVNGEERAIVHYTTAVA